MKKKRAIPAWFNIINLILVIGSIVWTIYSMFTAAPPDGHVLESEAIHVLTLIPMLGALLYCATGYKKSSAGYFNLFIYLYTAVVFATSLFIRTGPIFLSVFSIISFGILCVLAIAKDVGKKKSFVLCGLNMFLAIIRIIAYFITTGQFPGGMFGNLLLAGILGLMVYAKYADKTARGTE